MKTFTLLMLTLVLATGAATAQRYRAVQIPTRVTDTTKKYLAADVYSNDTLTPKPVILIQTPYNKNFYRTGLGVSGTNGAAVPYDSSAYNYVTVDWRGFYGSKDAAITPYNRGLDGYDIVEWIAAQPWCNGKIGTWGGSALGMIQFQTAAQKPPHLVCAAPFIKDFKTKYTDFYYGGDFRREHTESLEKLGFITVGAVLTHPSNDPVWRGAEVTTDLSADIAVPTFMLSGWFDLFPGDVIRAFDDLRKRSDPTVRTQHKLVFGPWLHSSIGETRQGVLDFANAAGVPVDLGMKFFNYYLRNIPDGWPDEPVVKYYQMGDNQWRTTADWNTVGTRTDTLYLRESGTLSATPPPYTFAQVPPDTLINDPRTPAPTIGGSRFNPFVPSTPLGPQDLTPLRNRPDTRFYTTGSLDRDLVLTGTSRAVLSFLCDRTDADLSARLCDVYPDGRWIILTQGIKRLRFRRSVITETFVTPGALDTAGIDLDNLAITFKKGHALGLVISGSNYPMFDINLHNGGAMYFAGDTLTATTLIAHATDARSMLTYKSSAASSVPATPAASGSEAATLNVCPNPGSLGNITVQFRLPRPCHVRLRLCDAAGRVLATPADAAFESGTHSLPLNACIPAAWQGALFLQLRAGQDAPITRAIAIF